LPSNFVARAFSSRGIAPEKISVNPYGANTASFYPREQDDLDRPIRFLCPSGVNIRKGARVLAQAWRRLGWKDAELHWVGKPDKATCFLFEVIADRIVWHSWMPQNRLAELYATCDVLVLPSFEEGFARVLVEGAASGLALIATPETGVEDFFSTLDPEGWLIEAGSVDSLCSAMESAKNNRPSTRSLGLRSADKAKQGFSVEAYGKRALEIFEKQLSF
jgi:glycosyltransferase involved in cell wall biosynthesis